MRDYEGELTLISNRGLSSLVSHIRDSSVDHTRMRALLAVSQYIILGACQALHKVLESYCCQNRMCEIRLYCFVKVSLSLL